MPPISASAPVVIFVEDAQVERMLKAAERAFSGSALGVFLDTQIAPYLGERAAHRFAAEGDDVVGQWAPLQPATEEIREAQGFPPDHPINARTHDLENYVTSGRGTITRDVMGATLSYPELSTESRGIQDKMRTAQVGKPSPQTVARPVLGVNEADLSATLIRLLMWYDSYVSTAMGGAPTNVVNF